VDFLNALIPTPTYKDDYPDIGYSPSTLLLLPLRPENEKIGESFIYFLEVTISTIVLLKKACSIIVAKRKFDLTLSRI